MVFRSWRGESGTALVTSLGILLILSMLGAIAVTTTIADLGFSGGYKAEQQSLYIAEAGIQHAVAVLDQNRIGFQTALNGPDGNAATLPDNGILGVISSDASRQFGEGKYTIRVKDNKPGNWIDTDGKVVVESTGQVGARSRRVEVLVVREAPGIRGAVTANGPIKVTGGNNMQIDGRNHDIDGGLTDPGEGTLGLSTRSYYTQSGSQATGGTSVVGVDYLPSHPANPSIVEINATWPPPDTPEKVIDQDLPVDALKNMADSGVAGSHYYNNTTPPNSATLQGITYINKDWDCDIDGGSGILVVHNDTNTAEFRLKSHKTFTGLIIADRVDNLHGTVIGAVVSLDTTYEHFGTGQGKVFFSRAALDLALSLAGVRPKILTWRDLH